MGIFVILTSCTQSFIFHSWSKQMISSSSLLRSAVQIGIPEHAPPQLIYLALCDGLDINIQNTQTMVISNGDERTTMNITANIEVDLLGFIWNGQTTERKDRMRFLGITYDRSLSLKYYIDFILQKGKH